MTSADIKRMVKHTMEFAPALLRCAEIVEAAEAAERGIASKDTVITEIRKEVDALLSQKKQAADELVTAQAQVEQAKKDTAQEKADLSAGLKDARDKLKTAQVALKATQDEHANTIAANKHELDELNIVLERKRKELADFRRSVPKTY